jgi:hypothetical protein
LTEELRLASFQSDRWQLDSGVLRHLEAPKTFWIPDEIARDSVTTGDLVKLIFEYELDEIEEDSFTVERMWVEITGRVGAFYTGSLANEPRWAQAQHKLVLDSAIVFLPEHIIDIEYATPA